MLNAHRKLAPLTLEDVISHRVIDAILAAAEEEPWIGATPLARTPDALFEVLDRWAVESNHTLENMLFYYGELTEWTEDDHQLRFERGALMVLCLAHGRHRLGVQDEPWSKSLSDAIAEG